MDAAGFWRLLKARGLRFFSGVPDSTFRLAYRCMIEDPEIRYVPAVREDAALGVASAAYFTGGLGGVVMQNSGLGNVVTPRTSVSCTYRVPVLLIVGWRGYGGPPNDAPEHWIMGDKTVRLLELLGLPYAVPDADNVEASLDRLLSEIEEASAPGALLLRAGVVE